jgi:hypothetical protein
MLVPQSAYGDVISAVENSTATDSSTQAAAGSIYNFIPDTSTWTWVNWALVAGVGYIVLDVLMGKKGGKRHAVSGY